MENEKLVSAVADSKEESIRKALEALGHDEEPGRELHRPSISLPKLLLGFFLWLAVAALAVTAVVLVGTAAACSGTVITVLAAAVALVFFCIKAKALIRSTVLIYQRYAPERLRRACLFTPSCSEYMLLAIDKYGTLVGFFKGCVRLCRCHHPNGGVDFP